MTYQEFLEELKKTKGQFNWRLNEWEGLVGSRENDDCKYCPLTAVYTAKEGKNISWLKYEKAAAELGMDLELADLIVNAADKVDYHDQYYRRDMLEIIGLL